MEDLIRKSGIIKFFDSKINNLEYLYGKNKKIDQIFLQNKFDSSFRDEQACEAYVKEISKFFFTRRNLDISFFCAFMEGKVKKLEEMQSSSELINNSIKSSGKLIYESHLILEEELKQGELRLLEVDY
jgi:hypothetical protein